MPDTDNALARATSAAGEALKLPLMLFAATVLAGAGFDAVTDRIAAAGALMGIFVVSLVPLVLPRLQIVKAYGIKVQLADQIRKAELTIEQFKRLARSTARQGLHQLVAGRHASYAEKRVMVDALNDSMDAAELTDKEAAEFRCPLFDMAAADLLGVVQRAALHIRGKRFKQLDDDVVRAGAPVTGAPDPGEAVRKEIEVERATLAATKIPARDDRPTADNVAALLDSCDSDFPRSPDDDRRLKALIAAAVRIMADCLEAENITADYDEFAGYLPRYDGGYADSSLDARLVEDSLRSRFALA